MKAVVFEKYGSPDVLNLVNIDKPTPKENELLIKVHATTVTAGDWRMRKADPFLARIFNGLFKPKRVKILGFELAGIVEAVGGKVKKFKPGDEVFASCGFKFGAYAEYTCLKENEEIALKPLNMSFAEAATIPIGGLTALRLLKQSGIRSGNSILIYGASGSVGSFGVQIAKAFGAEVTAVCSTGNIEMVTKLGADKVIDYTKQDLKRLSSRFDIVFDAVGKLPKPIGTARLKSGGKYLSVTGSPKSQPGDLLFLKALIEGGKLTTAIDRTYPLEDIRKAHEYVETFRKKGNVVVTVAPGI